MKNVFIFLLLPLLSMAQKKEVVYKKLANSTCDCITKKNEITEINLGLCIFEAIDKLDEKERKIISFNPDKKMASIERIAESVGLEMAIICPSVFSQMEGNKNEDVATVVESVEEVTVFFRGTFDRLLSNEVNTIILLDEVNNKKEFLWLYPFEGDNLFIKNKITKGDKLEIHYREQEFFNPKTNTYTVFNEITSLKFL